MELLLAGVSHKNGAPVSARESLAALGADECLRRLRAAGWREAVVVSTCNRCEFYAVRGEGSRAGGLDELAGFLEKIGGGSLSRHLYRRRGVEAVSHLFRVAAGLDSLVLGENEILGQVKASYETAFAAGATGKLTNILFQRALFVGKKVRGETGISAGQLSVSSVAVALAERIFGSLTESAVLVLGAGQMAELAARHLSSAKVARLRIANRTFERGRELAARVGAEAVSWEDFPLLLAEADVVLASTGAAQPVLTRRMAQAAMEARRGRPLFIIDIAMPRDVEDAVGDLDGVYLYTLGDLQGIVEENMGQRRREIAAAQALVERVTAEFSDWLRDTAAGRRATLRHAPGRSARRGERPFGGSPGTRGAR
jgi:glutamyl-tRNA reductase